MFPHPSRVPVLAAMASLAAAFHAHAISTHLNGNAQAGGLPSVFQSFTDVPAATLSGLDRTDSGNHAATFGMLSTPAGSFVIGTQAASEFVGSASGSAGSGIDLTYVVVSSTLPAGTPVQLDVRWATAARMSIAGTNLGNVQDVAQASLSTSVHVAVNNVALTNRSGGLSRRVTAFDGFQENRSGTLAVEADFQQLTVDAAVGQTVRIFIESDVSAGTFAFAPARCSADVHAAVVWGLSSLTADARVALMESPQEPAPPAAAASLAAAQQLLPPGPGCIAVTTHPQPRRACDGSAPFSVAANGPTPLDYTWQLETAPGVWQPLTASPAPIPCGGAAHATPANAPSVQIVLRGCRGAFRVRCVVSHTCGAVASDPAMFTVCPADFNCDAAINSQDLFDFLAAFFSGAADFNHDGATNSQDFFDFLAEFFVPC